MKIMNMPLYFEWFNANANGGKSDGTDFSQTLEKLLSVADTGQNEVKTDGTDLSQSIEKLLAVKDSSKGIQLLPTQSEDSGNKDEALVQELSEILAGIVNLIQPLNQLPQNQSDGYIVKEGVNHSNLKVNFTKALNLIANWIVAKQTEGKIPPLVHRFEVQGKNQSIPLPQLSSELPIVTGIAPPLIKTDGKLNPTQLLVQPSENEINRNDTDLIMNQPRAPENSILFGRSPPLNEMQIAVPVTSVIERLPQTPLKQSITEIPEVQEMQNPLIRVIPAIQAKSLISVTPDPQVTPITQWDSIKQVMPLSQVIQGTKVAQANPITQDTPAIQLAQMIQAAQGEEKVTDNVSPLTKDVKLDHLKKQENLPVVMDQAVLLIPISDIEMQTSKVLLDVKALKGFEQKLTQLMQKLPESSELNQSVSELQKLIKEVLTVSEKTPVAQPIDGVLANRTMENAVVENLQAIVPEVLMENLVVKIAKVVSNLKEEKDVQAKKFVRESVIKEIPLTKPLNVGQKMPEIQFGKAPLMMRPGVNDVQLKAEEAAPKVDKDQPVSNEQTAVFNIPIEQKIQTEPTVKVDFLNATEFQNEISANLKKMFETSQKELVIALSPKKLGKLMVRVVSGQDGITAQIITGNPRVKELLQTQSQLLKDNLSDQGVKVQQIEIKFSDSQTGSGTLHFGFGQRGEQGRPHSEQQKPNYESFKNRQNELKALTFEKNLTDMDIGHNYLA